MTLAAKETVHRILEDFSLEMTAKDIDGLRAARHLIPPGTRVNVTFLANENLEMRLTAVRTLKEFGFVPVPHISARRLGSQDVLEEYLEVLQGEAASENVLVVAGDPAVPEGPYDDSLDIIRSGLLPRHGVRHVSVAGYPDGHPAIASESLWSALEEKSVALRAQDLQGAITTQFGFDSEAVLAWVEQVRARGIGLPIRIGVPGPAGVKRLLTYATRFGVASSAGIAKKYGLSMTNLLRTAGPDRFISSLASDYDAYRHGDLRLHFYTFGGLAASTEWIRNFLGEVRP